MGKGTKVAIKIKGTVHGVKKALHTLTNPSSEPILREADFRTKMKKEQPNGN